MNTFLGLSRLMRIELPIAAGICVILGQILSLGNFPDYLVAITAPLSIIFISAAILVLNDYFDVESDTINSPHRPIPAGYVKRSEALIFAIVLFVVGFFLSYFISYYSLLTAFLVAIIGVLYNRWFKQTGLPGNILVSFSVGMTFIYGGITVGRVFETVTVYFAIVAALVDLGEEIAADAMDKEGDKVIQSKSIAIRYGRETALKISFGIFLLVVLLSIIPFITGWFEVVYLAPIVIMDLFIAVPAIKLLRSQGDEGRKYIRTIYLGATFSLLLFLIMRLFGI